MFCNECGSKMQPDSRFCNNCGATKSNAPPVAFGQQPTMDGESAGSANAYLGILHSFGANSTFFIGACMYAIAGVLLILMSFNIFSIFSLAILALPVAGLWMVHQASKIPTVPEKTLTALTLFKVSAIIGLVFLCLSGAIILIVSLVIMVAGAGFKSGGTIFLIFFLLAITAAIFIVIIKYYYIALLNTLNGIRKGIETGVCAPLEDVNSFIILSFIGIGFGILFSLTAAIGSVALSSLMGSILSEIPREYRSTVAGFMPSSSSFFTALLTMVSNVGLLFCIMTLKQFAERVSSSATNS